MLCFWRVGLASTFPSKRLAILSWGVYSSRMAKVVKSVSVLAGMGPNSHEATKGGNWQHCHASIMAPLSSGL